MSAKFHATVVLPQWKNPWHQLDWGVDGPRRWSARGCEENITCQEPKSDPSVLRIVTILAGLCLCFLLKDQITMGTEFSVQKEA